MPVAKLSSQALNIGGGPGGLNPVLVDGAAGGRISAPRINVNAGNVGFTPYDPGSIQQSTLGAVLEGAGNTANTYVTAAFQFQQKQDAVFAEDAAQKLNERMRKSFYGSPDAPGYSSSTEIEASAGYRGYEEQINAAVKEAMDGLTPHQKKFAMTKFHNLRTSYLQKGATHAASELTTAQENQKGRAYSSLMESLSTADVNLGDMQQTLAMYANDPDEYDKLNRRATENALYSTLRNKGAAQAIELAGMMSQTPGVGDGKTIDTFLNTLQGREDEAAREQRAINSAARTEATAIRAENDRLADNFLADNLQMALAHPESDMLKNVISTVESNLESSAAREKLQGKITSAIDEGWGNAALLGPGATAEYKAKMEEKIKAMPLYMRDDASRKLEEMEKKETDKVQAARTQEVKALEQEKKIKSYTIDSEIEQASDFVIQNGLEHPNSEEMLTSLLNNPNTTADQLRRIDRIINGTGNPFEGRELTRIEEVWDDIVDKPELLAKYDISEKKRTELKRRINTDRASGASDLRKSGYKELQTYYQLQSSPISGMSTIDGVTGLDEQAAKDNYQDAKVKFDSLMDGYLRTDKNLSPGEAYHKAMSSILGDENLRQGMTGLPKGTLAPDKHFEAPLSYQSDHKSVLNRYAIPQLPGFGDKPANIVEYVQQIGKDVKDGAFGKDPHIEAVSRINEVYDILNKMAAEATNVQEMEEVQRLIKNHTAQAMYVDTLTPESHANSVLWGHSELMDADTDKVNGQTSVRAENLAAEESDTAKGQEQTAQAQRFQSKASPSGMMRYDIKPGLGRYGRPVGTSTIGSTEKGATQRQEQGVAPYRQ